MAGSGVCELRYPQSDAGFKMAGSGVCEHRYPQPLPTINYYQLLRCKAIASAVESFCCSCVSSAQFAAEL